MLRRRPVARTVARTAVVAGTATAVSGNVARRQAARHAPAEPAPAPPPPAAPAPPPPAASAPPPPAAPAAPAADPMEQLTKLAALKQQGLLTDEEFATQKAKLLDQI
jgi:putative oligomerization/nucleic acid binding protein